MKSISPSDISTQELQSLMQTSVAPRPIALASTINSEGEINLSPFSFFNMVSTRPPILVFSPSRRVRDSSNKHTLANLQEVKEVVIGVVNYDMVQQVSLASTEYAKGVNEFKKAGLTMGDSELVRPKLIQESPVNFECEVKEIKSFGQEGGAGNLVICEVVKMHIDESFLDSDGNLDQEKLNLVARLGGAYYSTNGKESLFKVPKPLTTLGIGVDALPKEIRLSAVLTGNDLGMLANVEHLENVPYSASTKKHKKAQSLLKEMKVNEAWEALKENN